ncbi:MAG: hypothetical protein V7776_23105 [Halopseudomonas aestusnigri]
MTVPIFAEQGMSLRQMLIADKGGSLFDQLYSFMEEQQIELNSCLENTHDHNEIERLSFFQLCYSNAFILLDAIEKYKDKSPEFLNH